MSEVESMPDDSSVDSESSVYSVTADFYRVVCEDDGWSPCFDVKFDVVWGGYAEVKSAPHRVKAIKHFTRDNWRRMGEGLSLSTELRILDISESGLSEDGIRELFGEGRTCSRSLKILDVGRNPLGPNGMAALLPFVQTIPSLISLHLYDTNLDADGAEMLSRSLSNIHLEELNLSKNLIGDRGVEALLPSVNVHGSLTHFTLGTNGITTLGFEAISRFLNGNNTVTDFCVLGAGVESIKLIIDSIPPVSKLCAIDLNFEGNESGEDLTASVAPNVHRLLCNSCDFNALCGSNHRLVWVGRGRKEVYESYPDLRTAFDINARARFGASTVTILRNKLRTFYFKGNFSVQPFVDMNVLLLPYVLELMTRTELRVERQEGLKGSGVFYDVACNDNLSGIYRLVRNCHFEVFSFQTPETKVGELEARNAELERNNTSLEADNTNLRAENQKLIAEIESLRAGSSGMPNKRAKPSG